MNGILILNKPMGVTSHQVINNIKKSLNIKKIGHAGTLDPMATGVLVILINDATKLSNYLMADDKEYIAGICVGSSTDTFDKEGTIVETKQVVSLDNVDVVLESFKGVNYQIPPMYSAIKKDGKKLYELARAGERVELTPRRIIIHNIKRISEVFYENNHAYFNIKTKVSKGTYIRSLAVDIGEKLAYPAHLDSLERTKSGMFKIEDAYLLDDVLKGNFKLISLLDALSNYPQYELNERNFKKVIHGQVLVLNQDLEATEDLVVLKKDGNLVAIYKRHDNIYKAERVWN